MSTQNIIQQLNKLATEHRETEDEGIAEFIEYQAIRIILITVPGKNMKSMAFPSS